MDLNKKQATFPLYRTNFDITEATTGQVVKQHDVIGSPTGFASIQKNIVAMAIQEPYRGVHVMDLKSGKVLCEFILPDGEGPTVSLSKDTLTLAVGNNTGMT